MKINYLSSGEKKTKKTSYFFPNNNVNMYFLVISSNTDNEKAEISYLKIWL